MYHFMTHSGNPKKAISFSRLVMRLKKLWVCIMSPFTKRILPQLRLQQLPQQQNQLFMTQIVLFTALVDDAFGHITFWDHQNANVMTNHQYTMQQKKSAWRNPRKKNRVLSHVPMDVASCNMIWWVRHISAFSVLHSIFVNNFLRQHP